MRGIDRRRRIDAAVEDDERAVGAKAHAHVMHFAQPTVRGRGRAQGARHFIDQRRIGGRAVDFSRFDRLDMGFNLHVGADLIADRRFQRARNLMRLGEPHAAIDFKIEADAFARVDFLDGDMVDRQPPARALDDESVNAIFGQRAAILWLMSALIAMTRSSGSVRDTKKPTSPTICAPLGRSRTSPSPATPGACATSEPT